MRYNKKNTKKAIQRKLTTRKQRKNNRSLPRRTQYKTHKSYKQMKGGAVSTRTVKELLNPTNNDPSKFISDPKNPMLIGALIIKQYNEVKVGMDHLKNLPDIPNSQAILTANQNAHVTILANFYNASFKRINETPVVDEYSQFFSDLKAFQPDEFKAWLKYILEGNVYKKILPYYKDNEFNKFKLLALSLHKLRQVINEEPGTPSPPPPPSLEYEKYEVSDIGGLKGFLSKFVRSSILCEMCCVISLIRGYPKNWSWAALNLSEKKTISPNQYCANRRYKRLIVSPNIKLEPLSKFNVFKLTYQMQTVADYIRANDIITIIVKPMLAKLDIEQIKTIFEQTAQFKQIIIQDKNGFYKYYEFKIRRSSIVDPTNNRFFIPVIICTLSGFDEDGICDFEFVYVCVPKPNPPQSGVPVEKGYDTKVKQETFYKLRAEMTRIQSLLGGQTWTAPTTAEGTLKQYYDTKSLRFGESRSGGIATDGKSNEPPRVLNAGENSEGPCTLILNYEHNQENKKNEPIWKAAQATSTQIAAFNRVDEDLRTKSTTKLDDTMIRVYKISNDRPSPDDITVFVEVKKLGTNGELLRVVYQALGGERYEVYNNSTNARVAAELNKAHYNWAEDIGMV